MNLYLVDTCLTAQDNYKDLLVVTELTKCEILSRYRLGTSGNIRIIKGALKKRNLIEETSHQVDIQDPLFKQWILRVYKKL